jgi:hypothetical protein
MSDQPGLPGQQPQVPTPPTVPPAPAPPQVPPGWAPVQPPAAPGWGQPPGWGQAPSAPPGWAPPPKPGVIPLRPLGVGEILDGAISSIRRDPRLMLGVSALVVIASTLLQSVITWLLLKDSGATLTQPTGTVTEDELVDLVGGTVVTFLISSTISVLAQVLLTGILTFSVSKAVLGERPRAAEAWAATRRRLPALLGLTLLVLLIVGAAVALPVVPGIVVLLLGSDLAGALLLIVGVPAAIVLALAAAVLTWFAAPVVMLERQPVVAALRRSARLVRPNFWRVLGLWLLLQLIAGVLGGILSGPLAVVASEAFDNPFGWQSLSLQAVGTILANTVTLPFAAAVAVLVYVDQRMRREALDLELSRAAGHGTPGQSATPGT